MAAKPKYNPDYHDDWAWSLAAMGATNEEIAKAMGVSKRTIIRWSQEHESFGEALARGKGVSDAKVVRSLYQRAVGYEYEEEKRIVEYDKEGNIKPVKVEKTKKHVTPDVGVINGNMSLSTNRFSVEIPQGEYYIGRLVSGLQISVSGGTHGGHESGNGAHSHIVTLPGLSPGDHVLVVWVKDEPVVVDVLRK